MAPFSLTRPLVFLDLETTGLDPKEDRIVQIATCKVFPNFSQEEKVHLLDPCIPIRPEATAVHGITNDQVKGQPTFSRVVRSFLAYMEGCDIAGFNERRYDLELLSEECIRAGAELNLEGRLIPDAMTLFHHFHPRDLAAAVRTYLGVEHRDYHDALGDVRASRDVLWAMLEEHQLTIEQAAELCDQVQPLRITEFSKWFTPEDGDRLRFNRGKHNGKLLSEVAASDERGYLDWMLRQILDTDVQHAIAMAQLGARRSPPPRPRPAPAPEPKEQGSLPL